MNYDVLVMRPDGPQERHVLDLPDESNATKFFGALNDTLKPLIGSPIEHVRVFADFDGGDAFAYLDMFVNEYSGISDPEMPRNEAATAHYRRNVLFHEPDKHPDPEARPWIAGPAVLFRDNVWR